jgi:hypothetical protein
MNGPYLMYLRTIDRGTPLSAEARALARARTPEAGRSARRRSEEVEPGACALRLHFLHDNDSGTGSARPQLCRVGGAGRCGNACRHIHCIIGLRNIYIRHACRGAHAKLRPLICAFHPSLAARAACYTAAAAGPAHEPRRAHAAARGAGRELWRHRQRARANSAVRDCAVLFARDLPRARCCTAACLKAALLDLLLPLTPATLATQPICHSQRDGGHEHCLN